MNHEPISMAPELMPLAQHLAPGVVGYTIEAGGAIYIPIIIAEKPGTGDVGRYLDSLPRDRVIRVPNVLSERLAGMLERRGFRLTSEFAEDFGEDVEIWERK